MGLGVVFVNQLVKFDEKIKVDLDKMLERAREANERRYIGTVLTCYDNLMISVLCSCFALLHLASSSHLNLSNHLNKVTRRASSMLNYSFLISL
jgi:hypothetical protein